jgi:hypothetical protein
MEGWRSPAIPISKRKSQEPFPKPIYNFTPFWNFCAFLAQSAKNRAFRCNLFCGRAAKKDFRFNPSRPTGLSGFGTTSRNKNTTSPSRVPPHAETYCA